MRYVPLICDRLESGSYRELHETLPGISLVQVIHVNGPESVDEAVAVAAHVNAILLDSGNQSLSVKELGGIGRKHDWSLSRKIGDAVPVPIFLTGGLQSINIAEAIRQVEPFGVDVCSGVRSSGTLDEVKRLNLFQKP